MRPRQLIGLVFSRTASCAWLVVCWAWGCGPSVEQLIEKLADSEQREEARQELLLAKERAVDPLLAALDSDELSKARPHVVDVLMSLNMRVEDSRIDERLQRLLLNDSEPQVRARIARGFGIQGRTDNVEALIGAMADRDTRVRFEALQALNGLDSKLSQDQKDRALVRARALSSDEDEDVQMEARIRLASAVDELLAEARTAELGADLVQAEELYLKARAAFPRSKAANHRLGRFHYDNGRIEQGLQVLREHGMLLDVPRLASAPVIDGLVDDSVWAQAVKSDTFYQFSGAHAAAIPSKVRSEFYSGYTEKALFIGFIGYDDHPDSISVTDHGHDGPIFWEDVVEIFVDGDFDRNDYFQTGINTRGVTSDAFLIDYVGGNVSDEARAWNADSEAAAHVGADFWSLEYRVNFGQPEVPKPTSGTVWGFNFARTFRGKEYTQWTRSYGGNVMNPEHFGVLLFR